MVDDGKWWGLWCLAMVKDDGWWRAIMANDLRWQLGWVLLVLYSFWGTLAGFNLQSPAGTLSNKPRWWNASEIDCLDTIGYPSSEVQHTFLAAMWTATRLPWRLQLGVGSSTKLLWVVRSTNVATKNLWASPVIFPKKTFTKSSLIKTIGFHWEWLITSWLAGYYYWLWLIFNG